MNSKDGISVITPTIRSNCQNRIIDNFINQEFDNKELIIIINNDDMQGEILYEYANRYNNIKIFKISQSETLGKCLNFAIRQSTYNIIARFDDDDYYGKYYLKEAYDTFKNNDCDIIGKNKTYYYLEESKELLLRQNAIENDYWKWIAGATFCFKKEILEKIQFQEISRSEDTNFLKDAIENDLKIYSTSRYNYIVYRNGNVDAHTWKIGDDYFEDISEKVKVNIKYEECYPLVLKKIEYSYLNLEDEFEDVYVKCTTNQKRNYHNKIYKESVMDLIKDIPDSNGSRYYKKINKNIAIISDEFMFNYYNESVNLFYINYDNYQNIVEENKIDALLFITCWKGLNNGDWQGIANKPQKKQQIYEIIDKFKSKDIKIIFQSTEDPSDYNSYLDIAKKCDYIFTSDGDKVESYKLECNNKKVYSLEFGVNPLIHNPIGLNMHNKIDSILFAGSWMERFEERCSDMKMIFDGVIESGNKLDIIDRNFNIDEGAYYFPLKYVPCIIPTIDYKNLQKVHKLYDWCINVNSIKNSSTMCSRRIYEAQALGNLIISNYSKAIVKYNPNVYIIDDKLQVQDILYKFNKNEIYKQQIYGIRNIMSDKTVYEKLDYIFKNIDMNYNSSLEKKVLVVTEKITPKIKEMFEKQTYKNKHIIEEKNVKTIYDKYDFITFFKNEYVYKENYLQDMINGFKFTNSDYITKDSYYLKEFLVTGIEHNYVNKMKDKYKSIFDVKSYEIEYLLKIKGDISLENGYSIDRFEVVVYNDIEKFDISFKNIMYNKLRNIIYKNNTK